MRFFDFDNTYARELRGFYVARNPDAVPSPQLLFLNRDLAVELGLDADGLGGFDGVAVFSGNAVPDGAEPIAQAYAGHQFGGFSPQLGDGRALLLGEVINRAGQRRDIAFKGSGPTAFSRGGDGKAAVGPMLREAIVSEAMHALGIPTTRALAVAATGEAVFRDRTLPGAVLTRVAASHLRVGTFEFFAARSDTDRLRRLADYTIARHDSTLAGTPDRIFGLLEAVVRRQATLVARWMNVGFIHGVMNTDNMTISGETIDYGPCAFLETYDPATVFSSIDHSGRYCFGNQPLIARWNLARFAETLLPLAIDASDEASVERAIVRATEVIDAFPAAFDASLRAGQRAKLGLQQTAPDGEHLDAALADDWLALLHHEKVDFTLAWRRLAEAAVGDEEPLRALFADRHAPNAWLARWRARCALDDATWGSSYPPAAAARASRIRAENPFVIPRNHRVEEALAAASDDGELGPFERLLAAVRHPFDESAELAAYGQPAPAAVTAGYRTFCGT